MRRIKWAATLTTCFAVLASLGSQAWGQELGSGRIVITPGDMVSDGLGRAQAAVRDPFSITPITETAETIGDFDDPDDPDSSNDPGDLVSDAIRQLTVNAIAQFFAVIANDFLTQLGLPALFPTEFLTDLPDLSNLGDAEGTDPNGGEVPRDPEVPDDGTDDPDTTGGRGGRNGGRPRG